LNGLTAPAPLPSSVTIRRLVPADASTYRALMLEAYGAHPDAFTSTPEERRAHPLSWWEARVSDDDPAAEAVIGAFEERKLLGVAGVAFERRPKTVHKSTLFGMYLRPESRSRGIARALVAAAVDLAAQRPEALLIQLTVSDGNLAAQRLYEAAGFVRFGTEPYAIRLGETFVGKVHMWRWLRTPASL
jgi:RimJ/RimL family protein N-acetyltransferase